MGCGCGLCDPEIATTGIRGGIDNISVTSKQIEIMTTISLEDFIYDLQKLTAEDAIGEITTSGLTDKEIIECLNVITFNDTFKFNRY